MTSRESDPTDEEPEVVARDLLAFLVHDLKTPLASILSMLHRLEEHVVSGTGKQLLSDGTAAARRLERMVLDMLDLWRLEDGHLTLERVTVPLEDLVEEAVAAVSPLAVPRGVELRQQFGERGQRLVFVDFDLMTRVLVNLLENAVRHSPEKAPVTISTAEIDGGTRLCIDDCGGGVPEDERERVFEKSVRLDAGAQLRSGQGLGLTFARLVARAHGFEVGADDGPAGGGRFFVDFSALGETGSLDETLGSTRS